MSDTLDPSAILAVLPTLLPSDARFLAGEHDAVSALLHSVMTALGFRLIALDEKSPANEVPGNVLPDGWTAHGPDLYTFRYKHEQSSLVFLLKVVKLAGRTVIHGIALESNKTQTLDILTSDYTSPASFPYSVSSDSSDPLVHCFISSSRIKDLVSLYKLNILQKLAPGLRKDGYQEELESSTAPAAENRPSRSQPNPRSPPSPDRPYNLPTRSPEYDPLRIPNVGRSDLDPLGRNPFSPPSLFGGDGDGMYVGPNHPIFGGRGGRGGRAGPWGGDGFLPPMGAPPGARFDPIGPGPIGGFPGRGGGPFGPGGGFGGPRGGFGGGQYHGREPDNDEFMPPGADDMYS